MSKFEGNRTDNKGELTNEYKQFIATRIYSERLLTGLNQKDFAKAVGVSNQTFNNLEQGKGSLKIEYLYQIANFCGCDIGYLLGECENRTYVATDICKATGLSEEAVRILTEGSNVNYLTGEHREEGELMKGSRRTLINSLIIDSKDYYSLVGNLMTLLVDSAYIDEYKDNPWFDKLSSIIKDFDKSNMEKRSAINYAFMLNDIMDGIRQAIEEQLSEEGMPKEEINKVYEDTDQFFFDYRARLIQEDMLKGSLQNMFANYIDYHFFEGEKNGK